MIKPTIGRKVWFWPRKETQLAVNSRDQACDATVIYVFNDTMVNLKVTDHCGRDFTFTSVHLVPSDQEAPEIGTGDFATWMPYQKQQAAA